ncbi:hypothetical protein NW755_001844 [Fusarium falciforme]|uniref:Uncharacterized protein n=1 Tax=Fusarium falciforme TaxID=195108 RepID=A0A9W8RHH0_9HYPO|nr:hypothetical protein NW755_001844 [Fusarium falciforme]
MTTSTQSSSLVTLDSSAYEWDEDFTSGRSHAYDSQNKSHVVAISEPASNPVPTTVDELIDCFLAELGDRDVPHGPSTYQVLDLRALCAGCNMKTVEDGLEDKVKKPVALLDDRSRFANNQPAAAGYKRSNSGMLNASQLLVELRKERYNPHGQPDAERRLL